MRVLRSLAASVVAALILLGTASPVLASTAPPPGASEHDGFLRFEGLSTWEYVQSNGYRSGADSGTSVIEAVCDGGACVLDTEAKAGPSFSGEKTQIPIPAGGHGTAGFPASGEPCTASGTEYVLETRVDFTVSATSLQLAVDLVPANFTCPEGDHEYTGAHWEFTGAAVAGDPCVVEAAGCAALQPHVDATAPAVRAEPVRQRAAPLGTASRIATGAWDAPSVLGALPTVADAPSSPGQLLLAAAVTIVLVLLVALPTALLNSAVDAGAGRVKAAWARRRARVAAPIPHARRESSGWWWAATGVLAAAFIASFVDPGFGFNGGSLRVFASIAVSFLVEVVVGWSVLVWLVRRAIPGARASYSFQPLTLLIVALAVVVTRLTGFEPGIVFGLVAGVTFGSALALAGKARVSLSGTGYALALALLAWLGYSVLDSVTGDDPGAVLRFVLDALASLTIGGVASMPVALIPLRGLSGHSVWQWNKVAWFISYGVGMFAFFFVVMPMPFAWDDIALSLWTWVAIFVGYAVVAVALWLALARPWERPTQTPKALGAPSAEEAVVRSEETTTVPAD